MKKFLLLLVGVLFALSAKADWTFYVDISNTNWGESTPYIYCGKGATIETYGDAKFYSRTAGTNVEGDIWKFTVTGWDDLTTIFFSKRNDIALDGNKQKDITFDGIDSYGCFTTFQQLDRNWKAYNNALYILASTGTNAATFDTRYITDTWTISLRGADSNIGWSSPGITLKRQSDLTYLANTTKTLPASSAMKFVVNENSGSDQWTGYNSAVTPNTPFNVTFGKGGDFTLNAAVANAQIFFDPILKRVNIYEYTYYRFHGTIFTSGDANEGDWYTQKCMTDNGDGTYSFDATVKAGNFGIKELTSSETSAIGRSNKWIRAASGTGTINTANKTYAVAYEGGANDGSANLSSTLTGEYTIVFNKKDMTITFVRKVATVDYTIYFDAVRSGWESLTVTGVTATVEDDGTKALKKITYTAAEGTEVTFSNGTNSYKVIPTNGNVYYVESSSLKGDLAYNDYPYTPPTPVVKTAYTIYFDTFQSGWRNVTLLNEGVEVVGSLVKTGYIHGAKEDGVEGYLHKYTVNTTDATKLTFTNGTASYPLSTITDGNVYYVSKSGLADAALESYKVNAELSYRLHGQILGNKNWDTYKMTYFDGLWIYEADNFVAGNFGIKKLGKDEAVDKTESSSNPWIYAKTTDDNAHHVVIGAATNCAQEGAPYATVNPGNFYSAVTGTATLVFDPANDTAGVPVNDPNMTIMFINPAAVEASVAAEATTINGANANNLNVDITVADYYKGTGATEYTLSNGSYSATSNDGNFTNVPYATNYTLKPNNGSAMPINITLPTTTFKIVAQNSTLVAPAPDSGITRASLVVYFKATCDWWYNLPQIVCTCGGETISGTVVWNSPEVGTEYEYDFAFIANKVVAYEDKNATEEKTFKFVITPVYPFAVEAPAATPAPSMMRAAAANSVQYVAGAAVPGNDVVVSPSSEVSGVESVVIEAEDAPVEYFNLQGQRVNGDLAPGIYIRRQGTTVTKVRI